MPEGARSQIEAAGIEFVEIEDAASAVLHFASDKSINGKTLIALLFSKLARHTADLANV